MRRRMWEDGDYQIKTVNSTNQDSRYSDNWTMHAKRQLFTVIEVTE